MRTNTLIFIFMCGSFLKAAANDLVDVSKKVTKSFVLGANTVIASGNIYGSTNIIIKPGKDVTYDIDIKVSAADNEKAQAELDRISIEFSETPSRITGVTKIASKNSSWFKWNNYNKTKIDIVYNIYVPDNRSLALGQDYGNIKLPDYGGPVSIDVDYGDISGGDLSNNAIIEVDYGNVNLGRLNTVKFNIDYTDATIISANSAEVKLDYGEFNATDMIVNFTINTDYSEVKVGGVKSADLKGDYSHFTFGNAHEIVVNTDYGDCNVRELKGNLSFTGDYSTARLDNVASSVNNIDLTGDYSNLKVGFIDGYNYTVRGEYSSVNTPNKQKSKGEVTGQKSGRSSTEIMVKGDYNSLSIK